MLSDEEMENVAREVVTEYLERDLVAANENAVNAAETAREEEQAAAAAQAKRRMDRWLQESSVEPGTARAIFDALVEEMTGAYAVGAVGDTMEDTNPFHVAFYRAGATRDWLVDQGHDLPELQTGEL